MILFSKVARALADPGETLDFVLSRLNGSWYKLKYQTILKKAVFGKGLKVRGRLVVRGPGRVFFGDDVRCWGRVTPYTHGPDAVIRVGDNVFLSGTRFGARQSITVGSDSMLGDCNIMDNDFHGLGANRREPGVHVETRPVTIGRNVWICGEGAVLKGVTIGENAVVGYGSVVTRDVAADTVVAGNPAQPVRRIPSVPPLRRSRPGLRVS